MIHQRHVVPKEQDQLTSKQTATRDELMKELMTFITAQSNWTSSSPAPRESNEASGVMILSPGMVRSDTAKRVESSPKSTPTVALEVAHPQDVTDGWILANHRSGSAERWD